MNSENHIRFMLAVAATLVLFAGCVEKSSSVEKSESKPRIPRLKSYGGKPKQSEPIVEPTAPQRELPLAVQAVAPQPDFEPPTQPAGSNTVEAIHLSAGAALPVPLPQGTTMSFSAEYQFRGGEPQSGVRYVVVVQDRSGREAKEELSGLKSQGQLPSLFVSQFRPEDAPFQAFIEEHPVSTGADLRRPGKRVSNLVPLR